jgi:outer membrane immunogenic protein
MGAFMKKILCASVSAFAIAVAAQPAAAADLPVKAPPIVVEVWSWSGWYAGINGGYSWGRSRTDLSLFNNTTGALVASSATTFNLNGGVFGGQVGFNRQNGQWVWGLEADLQWTGERGQGSLFCNTAACLPTAIAAGGASGATNTLNQRIDWFSTFRGRLGITPSSGWLAYVTGGAAIGSIKMVHTVAGFDGGGAPVSITGTSTQNRLGWTVGAGAETRLSSNWVGRLEYLYLDFGTVSGSNVLLASTPPLRGTYNSRVTDHVLRAAISYKWGDAIVARY